MALISGKGPRRVGVNTRGIQLWTDPVCTDEELRRLYDGLVMFYGAASVFVVEEAPQRKRIPYPEPPEPPGELVRTEDGRQVRRLATDWPTLEQVLIAKRGPLKNRAHERESIDACFLSRPMPYIKPRHSPMFKAVAEELALPGVVEELVWVYGSRMVAITYKVS